MKLLIPTAAGRVRANLLLAVQMFPTSSFFRLILILGLRRCGPHAIGNSKLRLDVRYFALELGNRLLFNCSSLAVSSSAKAVALSYAALACASVAVGCVTAK